MTVTVDNDVASRLRVALARLNRRLRNADQLMELTESQLFALAALNVRGPLRLSDLAAHEHVSAPTATRLVASLEERGLVRRQSNPEDRRSTLLAATPAGRRTLDRARSARTVELTRRLGTLTADERRAVTKVLPILERLAADE
ncbi:MAG: MarR family winged helix-turn-helix transcriptional regulator [Actinomycetes bacterium]